MKKVYQRIVDRGHGDCMQAAVASLFDDEYENVPAFIEYGAQWFKPFYKYAQSKGYEYMGMLHNKNWNVLNTPTDECWNDLSFNESLVLTVDNIQKETGVNGLFLCSVLSPKFFSWNDIATHAVICDSNLNIIHDPQIEYKDIKAYPLTSILGYNGIINVYLFDKKDE